jgi:hypothetical protein
MFFTMGPRRQLDAGPLFAMQTIAGLQRGDLPPAAAAQRCLRMRNGDLRGE